MPGEGFYSAVAPTPAGREGHEGRDFPLSPTRARTRLIGCELGKRNINM